MTESIDEYFDSLNEEFDRAYQIAKRARARGMDPKDEPEIPPAEDLAARVEKLVGPKGVADIIRELEKSHSREELAFKIVEMIVDGEFGDMHEAAAAEQAIRTVLAIITEGVAAAAPIEGVTKVEVRRNFDGTPYLAIYFAGPIRSAGGTAAALAVLAGDFVRSLLGLSPYEPSDLEVERFGEEVSIYSETSGLQYTPSKDEVLEAVRNIPVEIAGEPTEREVVTAYRDLDRIETNRIRGGAVLALAEGVLQKASKILRHLEKLGLEGWEWLSKMTERSGEEETSDRPGDDKYLEDVIGGRPVLSHPHREGGFRLRYGRARNTGLAAVGVHPATMRILDDHISTGTQLKTERPGKAAVVAPVDTLEGPVVKLDDGSVVRVRSAEEAEEVRGRVTEILSLGDLLVGFGEFLKNNHPLMPAGYSHEWWAQEVKGSLDGWRGDDLAFHLDPPHRRPPPELAVGISEELGVPLHPDYTYPFSDLNLEEIEKLGIWLSEGEPEFEDGVLKEVSLEMAPEPKRILERLTVPHKVEDGKVSIGEDAFPLCRSLGLIDGASLDSQGLRAVLSKNRDKETLEILEILAGFPLRAKAPTRIGCRVGRPEKSKPRKMGPPPHVLFPIGMRGGQIRSILKAADKGNVKVEVANLKCPSCGTLTIGRRCPECGTEAEVIRSCPTCREPREGERCMSCGTPTVMYEEREIDLKSILNDVAGDLGGDLPDEVKGVRGLISALKLPEPLEKGVLRAKHGVYVFKDGTVRFDATNVPLTHFRPWEIGTSIGKLREMGYEEDYEGEPLEKEDQIVELRVQDILISEPCADYLLRSSKFVDELLEKFYGLPPFYETSDKEDLVGHLVIGLAPHTSAGIVGRIIGFSEVGVGYAHPYFHAAKRRNADGDEDSVMLLLDGLLNFSKSYLPESRGGSMDAPLVLTTRLDPSEIDDEAHDLDVSEEYSLEFYEATLTFEDPSKLASEVETVKARLGTPGQYEGLHFSRAHDTSSISAGPSACRYKTLGSMVEKVDSQLSLARRIMAVDERDVAERVIENHFIPDLKGNLRAFSTQKFRCTTCNKKYRRVPLAGECVRCGGKLILTVPRGGVEKYMEASMKVADEYGVSGYIRQRLSLIEEEIKSIFGSERQKQLGLGDFVQ